MYSTVVNQFTGVADNALICKYGDQYGSSHFGRKFEGIYLLGQPHLCFLVTSLRF